jgi:hypothetical protein
MELFSSGIDSQWQGQTAVKTYFYIRFFIGWIMERRRLAMPHSFALGRSGRTKPRVEERAKRALESLGMDGENFEPWKGGITVVSPS